MRIATLLLTAVLSSAASVTEAGPERFRSVSLGAGWVDFNRRGDEATEIRVEYRSAFDGVRVLASATTMSDTSTFVGVGVGYSFAIGHRLILTPSFVPGVYLTGSGKELGSVLEFRSQIELAYELPQGPRVLVAVSHMSNAGLGSGNPGEEKLSIGLEIPIWRRRGK